MKITDVTVTEFSLGKLKTPYWNSIIRTANKGFSRIEIHTATVVVLWNQGNDHATIKVGTLDGTAILERILTQTRLVGRTGLAEIINPQLPIPVK